MKYRQLRCSLVIAAAIMSATSASAVLAVPYQWGPGQIQGLADVTPGFHGGAGQLSTIDSITPIPNGVELRVTYRIGQDADPFAPNYGLTFARVSLQGGLGFPGLDLSGFTSSRLTITSSTDITAQSFLQTDFTENGTTINDGDANAAESFSFLFWEHNDGVGMGSPTDVDFDFTSGTELSGDWGLANPQPVQGTNAIRAWGLQLAKFSGMVVGQPVQATIRLEGIPEPTSAMLAGFAALALTGFARRRG
jgi:hypothetical protein